MPTSFDTLALYEKLKESGVPDSQAAAHSSGLNDALAHVATKSDLREVKMDLREVKVDIENLKISTHADMAAMKSDIISWIVGMFLGLVVLMVAAVFGLLPLVLK
uniref:DUF1640 domain-containing protein n=1 Tax=Candidatus Kentrum sp. LPFa TaxID=2126335 RepID=A0A450W896_9GAMM|nr:MAG: hypothetical protein BECKLPF1236B_GA0070989_104516 [Candidatus Kentron sp. LPFa]VFK18190.1 MAG: hypothetical protein BECKLPF1236A_GA0070988_101924 [Candidatus Kentron sp. LPFa]VFK33766.1 MAG: hypothetical protein BECKLPF1236C_GA0070990_102233 [Candidatus Kentron sp. LPFa]